MLLQVRRTRSLPYMYRRMKSRDHRSGRQDVQFENVYILK
jgi:hypothetical protein